MNVFLFVINIQYQILELPREVITCQGKWLKPTPSNFQDLLLLKYGHFYTTGKF
jgi:hypothetical protein